MTHLYDPGPVGEPFAGLVGNYPGTHVYPSDSFRVEWGPIFHRGRLDGSARLPVIGQDRLAGVGCLGDYVTGKLPRPPATVSVPKMSYPIDGNDQYGDCTIAGVAHLIATWNVEVAEKDPGWASNRRLERVCQSRVAV